ncbi:MAG: hypothetical protein NZ765_01130 [Anaerolineae bacterium]|nr:hypothetical protein [Anaerolineae bacterium]MDW8072142.1 hypothetical protein [Anaerolineae bacterium]
MQERLKSATGDRTTPPVWCEVVLLALVMAVAIILRVAVLDQHPRGLYYDEAAYAMDAVDTLQSGHWPVFYHTHSGKEPLWIWMLAVLFTVTEVGVFQIHLLAAAVGITTVFAIWWTGREMFRFGGGEGEGAHTERAFWIALFAAAVLATLFFHVHLSRSGYRLLTQPLITLLAVASLWRALRGVSLWWFVVAGLLSGFSLYTYTSARLNLALFAMFFAFQWLLWRFFKRQFRLNLISLLVFWTLTLTVITPMSFDLFVNPEFAFGRGEEVSVFNPVWNKGDPGLALLDSIWRNLAGLIWKGSEDTHWNLPGRPMLDFLTIPLFLVGSVVTVRNWKYPVYLFTLLWLLALYIPAFLSYDRVPVFHRAIGVVPAVAMITAIGAYQVSEWITRLTQWDSFPVRVTILAGILCVSGGITAYDYFVRWAPSWGAYLATQPYFLDLVRDMNSETEENVVYLFPYDVRSGKYEHPVLRLFYRGSTPYYFISDHEGRILKQLTSAVSGKEVVRVVDWQVGRGAEADPKRLIPTLLTMYGTPLGTQKTSPAYHIESFRLSGPNIDFQILPHWSPLDKAVGDELLLRSFSMGPCGYPTLQVGNPWRSGQYGWIALMWESIQVPRTDYKASVRLLEGEKVHAQNDKILFNGFHLETSRWGPGEVNFDIYLLRPSQPGQYELRVIVYSKETGIPLNPEGIRIPETIEVLP